MKGFRRQKNPSFKKSAGSLLLGLSSLFLIQSCSVTNPYYNPTKPHHTPEGFVNSDGTIVSKSFSDLMRWYRERFGKDLPPPPGQYVQSYAAFPVRDFRAEDVAQLEQSVSWLGHATMLVKSKDFTLLTDPHFSMRAFPVQWAGPARKVRSPARVKDLPKVDVVVISHNHYDHLDYQTIMELASAQPEILFLVPLGVEETLKDWGVNNVVALDWWETHRVKETDLTLVPAYHWSARSVSDRNKTLWGGWTLVQKDFRFFFSGDTGYSKDFTEIGKRLGPFDLSAIAVGAYEPRWFMKAQHINPDEAVQIHKETGSKMSIGMHWGTFELTDEPIDQPIGDLAKAREKHGLSDDAFRLLEHGQTLPLVKQNRQ